VGILQRQLLIEGGQETLGNSVRDALNCKIKVERAARRALEWWLSACEWERLSRQSLKCQRRQTLPIARSILLQKGGGEEWMLQNQRHRFEKRKSTPPENIRDPRRSRLKSLPPDEPGNEEKLLA
jgi:hypothetical protein